MTRNRPACGTRHHPRARSPRSCCSCSLLRRSSTKPCCRRGSGRRWRRRWPPEGGCGAWAPREPRDSEEHSVRLRRRRYSEESVARARARPRRAAAPRYSRRPSALCTRRATFAPHARASAQRCAASQRLCPPAIIAPMDQDDLFEQAVSSAPSAAGRRRRAAAGLGVTGANARTAQPRHRRRDHVARAAARRGRSGRRARRALVALAQCSQLEARLSAQLAQNSAAPARAAAPGAPVAWRRERAAMATQISELQAQLAAAVKSNRVLVTHLAEVGPAADGGSQRSSSPTPTGGGGPSSSAGPSAFGVGGGTYAGRDDAAAIRRRRAAELAAAEQRRRVELRAAKEVARREVQAEQLHSKKRISEMRDGSAAQQVSAKLLRAALGEAEAEPDGGGGGGASVSSARRRRRRRSSGCRGALPAPRLAGGGQAARGAAGARLAARAPRRAREGAARVARRRRRPTAFPAASGAAGARSHADATPELAAVKAALPPPRDRSELDGIDEQIEAQLGTARHRLSVLLGDDDGAPPPPAAPRAYDGGAAAATPAAVVTPGTAAPRTAAPRSVRSGGGGGGSSSGGARSNGTGPMSPARREGQQRRSPRRNARACRDVGRGVGARRLSIARVACVDRGGPLLEGDAMLADAATVSGQRSDYCTARCKGGRSRCRRRRRSVSALRMRRRRRRRRCCARARSSASRRRRPRAVLRTAERWSGVCAALREELGREKDRAAAAAAAAAA